MNILITGVNGFIGKALAQELIREGHGVSGLDITKGEGDPDHRGFKKFFVQDITQPFDIAETFDYVFHLAALNVTHVGKVEHKHYQCVNVLGTENLLAGVKTKKFVLMSTIKVYCKEGAVIDERSSLGPEEDYEKSKLAAEELCCSHFQQEQLVVLRPVNIVGPGQADKAVMPVFFSRALLGNPIEIFAPRNTHVHLLYIDDVINAFKKMLDKKELHGIFNLVSLDTISLEDLALEIVRITGSSSSVVFTNEAKAPDIALSSCYAKAVLGWEPCLFAYDIVKKYHSFLKGL